MSPTRNLPGDLGCDVAAVEQRRQLDGDLVDGDALAAADVEHLAVRASPADSASAQARATSWTLTKSRCCSPSSKTSGGRPLSSREAKIASTPV
jgi:hypothetical protein